MKIRVALPFLLLLLSQCTTTKKTGTDHGGWKLVWADEFNYSGLPNSSKWSYDVGDNGWGNNELQYYDSAMLRSSRVEDGHLVITAQKGAETDKKYTSARLVTKDKQGWKYGKIEVRAKLPKGLGSWPAIWMLAEDMKQWPDDGEIDIMEHVGYNSGFVHASIHCKSFNHIINTQKTDTVVVKDFAEAFHTYGVEWNKDWVKVSVDENVYFTFQNDGKGYDHWPFDNKMFLILNIAVGGNWGGAKGMDDASMPWQMQVDYVRVWQR